MRILLANPRGFCAGVKMAIGSLARAIELLGPPLYVYHEIVHNRHVVEEFRRRGAVFVDDVDEVPEGAHLLYSAHGVSPDVRRQAERRDFARSTPRAPWSARCTRRRSSSPAVDTPSF